MGLLVLVELAHASEQVRPSKNILRQRLSEHLPRNVCNRIFARTYKFKTGAFFYSFNETGSDRFFGDCLFSRATSSRPDAGTPTLPSRTICLALSSRP